MTTTISVRYLNDPSELHEQRRGDLKPRPAMIELDPRARTLRAYAVLDDGQTFDQWHGRVRCYAIPRLTAAACNELLDLLVPLAARVADGFTLRWDGSNHVGELDDDAQQAEDLIDAECSREDRPTVVAWSASDWFGTVGDLSAQADACGITHATTDDELRAIETREAETFKSEVEGVAVLYGLHRHLVAMREAVRYPLYARDVCPTYELAISADLPEPTDEQVAAVERMNDYADMAQRIDVIADVCSRNGIAATLRTVGEYRRCGSIDTTGRVTLTGPVED